MRIQATVWLLLFVCVRGVTSAQPPAKDLDTLAGQVFAALAARDRHALETLRIDRAEFKKYIWPTLASHVAGGEMNADKFYGMYDKSSTAALDQHLAEYGGRRFEVVKVTTGPERRYKGYCLLPNPEITIRGDGGQEQIFKLGSSLIERDGALKVTSYYRGPTGSAANR